MPENTQNLFSNIGTILAYTTAGMLDPSSVIKMQEEAKRNEIERQLLQLTLANTNQIGQSLPNTTNDFSYYSIASSSPSSYQPISANTDLFPQTQFQKVIKQSPSGKIYIDVDQTPQSKIEQDLWKMKSEIPIKISEEEEKTKLKDRLGAKNTVGTITDLYDLYIDSMLEREQKYPGSSQSTPKGRMGRIASKIESNVLQTLPKTQAFFNVGRKAAYEMARAIEGGRVTDQDVDIVYDALFNSDLPLSQSVIQANFYINSLKRKGLTDQELEPLRNLVDLSQAQIMVDAQGNRALVSNGKVLREIK